MRLVLDTNIVVSGLFWGGVPRQLLDFGRVGQVTLFTSSVLLDELADVLGRNKFNGLLTSQQITPAFLMQHYGMLANLVKPASVARTVPNDPDDDHVLACAVAAQADYIVSGDQHLLTLKQFQNIPIITAAHAVQVIRGSEG